MKTITITDEVYEKLVRIKGNKSFSVVIDELIRGSIEKRIELLIKAAERTGYEHDLERIAREVRRGFKARYETGT
ncbi:MAG: antitoxin VapB family protein [Candidatus Nitrosocaldus sp.]|nr:antitoxin VapB family protein [Candidatus Nitrosocaldus sp.]MDW8001027.1 antitoxin VapB family protein [Candidatus Nitrosocaldus sp.]